MSLRSPIERDDGISLIEVLITIVIVGIAFSALLGAAIASITASATRRELAEADALVRDAAEWLKSPAKNPYVPCAGTGSYGFRGFPAKEGYALAVVAVDFWDGAPRTPGSPYQLGFQSRCGDPAEDLGLQRITVQVTSPGGAVEVVPILKRRTDL